ncbi:MAG: PAS-domain containing protein [Magnetospirillum sp.]|nr:PAS-domain containing protein [Magnetospirillum sp.]
MAIREGRLGLRTRIAVAIAATCLASIIVVVGYLKVALERQAVSQWHRERGQMAAALGVGFDRALEEMLGDLRFASSLPAMAALPELKRVDPRINGIPADLDHDKRRTLDGIMEDGRFSVLFVLQPNGDHYLSHPFDVQRRLQRFNLADRPYFQQATRSRAPVISDAFMGADGIPAVAIDVPRLDAAGEIVLHLGGVIHLPRLTEIFSAAIQPPFDMGLVTDRQGTVIAAAGQGQSLSAPMPGLVNAARAFLISDADSGEISPQSYVDPDGNEEVIVTFIKLKNGWSMALARQKSTFLAEIRPEVTSISTMVGALLLLVSAIGFFIANHIAGRWEAARKALAAAHETLESRVRERTADLDASRQELAAKSRTLETILDNISQGISVYDENLRMTAFNRRFVELLRLPPELARPGTTLEQYLRYNAQRGEYGDGDPERLVAERLQLAQAFKPHRFQRQGSDGAVLEVIGSPLPGGGFVATHTDITEAKRAEEALRTLSRAIEQSPVSVVITDPNGDIDYVNPRFTTVCGYTLDEVRGQNPRILKSGQTPDSIYQELWTAITAGSTWEGELHNRKKNGEFYWERASISPIRSPDGTVLHYLAVKEDITARKTTEDNLIAALQAAKEANRAKTVFLSHMSHELRTPLTAVLGYAEMMGAEIAGPLPPIYSDYVASVGQSGRHLLSIIDEVLDISRIELGSYRIAQAQTDLAQIVRECGGMVLPQCTAKDIILALPETGPMMLESDERALRQILINLLGNAIKYTPAGGAITVTLEAVPSECRVTITDTGCGIPADKQSHIFEPFQRVDPLIADRHAASTRLVIVGGIAALYPFPLAVGRDCGRMRMSGASIVSPPIAALLGIRGRRRGMNIR